jgi:hypothetical protein
MRIFLLVLVLMLVLLVAGARGPNSTSAPATNTGLSISRADTRTVTQGSPKFFTGSVKVEQLFAEDAPSRVSGGIVTFVPGARSAWHTHPFGVYHRGHRTSADGRRSHAGGTCR